MMRAMPKAAASPELTGLGRYAGPATLILSSLAGGPKHGYALTKDVEQLAGVRLAPGTLYEALQRLESQGLSVSTSRGVGHDVSCPDAQPRRATRATSSAVVPEGLARPLRR